jgi:pilus assembly protein Flp/PilA
MRHGLLKGHSAPGNTECQGGFRLVGDERGVTAIEYTLIAALIAIAAVALITQIGSDVIAPFSTIASRLQ